MDIDRLLEECGNIPALLSQRRSGNDAMVMMHLFADHPRTDWYVTEYGPSDSTFFGLVRKHRGETREQYFQIRDLKNFEADHGPIMIDDCWIPKKLGVVIGLLV